MPCPRLHELYSGPLVTLTDFRCGAPCGDKSGEEFSVRPAIAFVRRGAFYLNHGTQRGIADPTQVLFFNKEESYKVEHPIDGGDDCTVFSINDALARDLGISTFQRHVAPAPEDLFLRQRRLLSRAKACASSLETEEEAIGLVAELLSLSHRAEPAPASPELNSVAHKELAEATRQVINARFKENLGLTDIAESAFSSPFHLSRVFRRITGSTIHEYLERVRVRTALELLAETGSEIRSIAAHLGYSSPSHFVANFHKLLGVTPRGYRLSLSKNGKSALRVN